jgi:mercuric ion transport protein
MSPRAELVYFTGCPNVDASRDALRAALAAARLPLVWQEWDQADATAPAYVDRYGSPTVLVDGRDVTGAGPAPAGPTCCMRGAPDSRAIFAALMRTDAELAAVKR